MSSGNMAQQIELLILGAGWVKDPKKGQIVLSEQLLSRIVAVIVAVIWQIDIIITVY